MAKKTQIRIIEILVHRSKKNPRLGHAVASLFPCNHHKYLGFTLYKGDSDTTQYRTQYCRVIKFEDYDVTDKEVCKLCPQDEFFIDDLLPASATLEDFADVLEAAEDW